MTDNVRLFTGITKLDLPIDLVLDKAKDALEGGEGVVVLGYDADGDEYFAASYADGPNVLWLLERLKKKLLAVPETHFGVEDE